MKPAGNPSVIRGAVALSRQRLRPGQSCRSHRRDGAQRPDHGSTSARYRHSAAGRAVDLTTERKQGKPRPPRVPRPASNRTKRSRCPLRLLRVRPLHPGGHTKRFKGREEHRLFAATATEHSTTRVPTSTLVRKSMCRVRCMTPQLPRPRNPTTTFTAWQTHHGTTCGLPLPTRFSTGTIRQRLVSNGTTPTGRSQIAQMAGIPTEAGGGSQHSAGSLSMTR
jgi:hypothetical protein